VPTATRCPLHRSAGLRRRGLLLATGFRADRRSWAGLRRRGFRDLPRQRNRVWQLDFSEFETARGGIWRIRAVIDYLDDLGADRGVMDVVDADDEVIGAAPAASAVVTDNGPCFGGVSFADAFAGDDPLLGHLRTPVRSP
jgi:putative transposase